MEGGKIEEERIGSKRGRDDDEKGNMGRLEKRPSGMVVIEEYSGDEMINGVKYEEEKITSSSSADGGEGLLNQLITNLVNSPKPNQQVETDVFEAGSEKKKKNGSGSGGGGGGGGGVINNLISNIFSSNGGGGGEVVEKGGDGGGGEVVVEKGGVGGGGEVVEKGGGGNTIDNIVSKLPRTLSEDAVPAIDEASILLHSIIHD